MERSPVAPLRRVEDIEFRGCCPGRVGGGDGDGGVFTPVSLGSLP